MSLNVADFIFQKWLEKYLLSCIFFYKCKIAIRPSNNGALPHPIQWRLGLELFWPINDSKIKNRAGPASGVTMKWPCVFHSEFWEASFHVPSLNTSRLPYCKKPNPHQKVLKDEMPCGEREVGQTDTPRNIKVLGCETREWVEKPSWTISPANVSDDTNCNCRRALKQGVPAEPCKPKET